MRLSFCLLAILVLASSAALARGQARWPDERQAGPLWCHADFSLAGQEPLLDELTLLQADLQEVLGARRTREPVHLFLFQTKATYQGYLRQYFPRVPYRRALYIKARGPGMVFAFQGEDFEIDVRHECTHALLHGWLPTVPLWLDEGLAEYFEAPRDARVGQNPHLETTRALVRSGQLPRLEELESLTDIEQMGRDEYRDAWAWIHWMLHGPPAARDELRSYLADLADGGDIGPLSRRLRRRIPSLSATVAEHFR
ncbi:MAG: DUF1570 domain-containing protein [Pirellulaceae bacterium]|nr:DUF1570 domain-containing protein [Pirellulaceae bacterium]